MNRFGGDWTEQKIEIIYKYARAYLAIMNSYVKKYNWKTLYFDGFAGSGYIENDSHHEGDFEMIEGTALKILGINIPISFDRYYFVELNAEKAKKLEAITKSKFPAKKISVVSEDCNKKLLDMSRFLSSPIGKKYKVLAFIDPFGMQLKWESIAALKGFSVDIWILVPSG